MPPLAITSWLITLLRGPSLTLQIFLTVQPLLAAVMPFSTSFLVLECSRLGVIPLGPASSLIPGQKSLSFRRQLHGSSGRSEGFVSTLADTGLGPGLGGVTPTGGGPVGACGLTSGALGAGGGIEGNLEATPSSLVSPPGEGREGLGD